MKLQSKEKKINIESKLRTFFVYCSVVFLFFIWLSVASAATLSQLYGYLLEKNDFLLTQKINFYRLLENSHHASPDYDKVDSRLELFSWDTFLKFAPLRNLEMNFGFAQTFPTHYSRSTYDTGGDLAVMQNYGLEYLRDFIFQMRLNQGSFQPYISILEKRQNADWDAVLLSPPANYYSTRILTHYEDFCLGLRYLSGQEGQESAESNLSLLRRPLLEAKQFVVDTRISYQKAALRRNSRFYFDPWFLYDYFYQRLDPRYTPKINLGYGLTDNLELTSGLAFSFPYRFRYSYQRYFLGDLFNGVRGRYLLKRSFDIPLQLRYRLKQNLEIHFSSDLSYSRQELDYSDFNGVKTVYETKKLEYFNAQPSITLSYLADGGKEIKEDRFSRLTQAFLSSGQFFVEFRYLRDLTDLDKNAANGAQNKIIPYELFVNPLELFASGTEYAAAFTGNKSDTAANVAAQNYHLFQLAVRHGFFDRFNAGAGIGYRTSSHFHHFVLAPDASFGRLSRAYTLKPYWFFSVPCDWRFNENSLLSLVWYYVPQYRTEIGIEGVAKEFKSKTNYYSISLALKVLF